jgi:hypothetical protein
MTATSTPKNHQATDDAEQRRANSDKSNRVEMILDESVERIKRVEKHTATLRLITDSGEQADATKDKWQTYNRPSRGVALNWVHTFEA